MNPATSPTGDGLIALAPTTGGERISLLDALRGFALAGVLFVNMGALTLPYYLTSAQRAALPTAGFDKLAEIAMVYFAYGKFITLFSLLFGLGFSVQLMRAKERGGDARGVYIRRLLVLLLIGLAHATLLWWGDVLVLYAVLGFALLLFRNASNRTLLWTGLALACIGSPLLRLVVGPLVESATAGLPSMAEAKSRALAAFSGDDYAGIVRANLLFEAVYFSRNWTEPFVIFSRFLLGFWAGRVLLFHRPADHRVLLAQIFGWGAAVGLLGNGVAVLRYYFDLTVRLPLLAGSVGAVVLDMFIAIGTLALGAAYATGFALLFLRPAWRPRLEVLSPVGRMALTNYLGQTVICLLIFYGIGLGVGPRFGYPGLLAAFVLIFAMQIAFSRWWLKRFRFGPAEWMWRSLVYGRAQLIRAVTPPAAASPEVR